MEKAKIDYRKPLDRPFFSVSLHDALGRPLEPAQVCYLLPAVMLQCYACSHSWLMLSSIRACQLWYLSSLGTWLLDGCCYVQDTPPGHFEKQSHSVDAQHTIVLKTPLRSIPPGVQNPSQPDAGYRHTDACLVLGYFYNPCSQHGCANKLFVWIILSVLANCSFKAYAEN